MAALGLLVFLLSTGMISYIERPVEFVLNPVMSGLYGISTKFRTFYQEQTGKHETATRIAELEQQAAEQAVDRARLLTLEDENKILRQYLSFGTSSKRMFKTASVIARNDLESGNQSVIIDRGKRDSLAPGLAVVSGEGVVVGKVIETGEHTAVVALSTQPECKLAATILNVPRTTGMTRGELGLTIVMDFIPQIEKIEAGDLVVTSGLENNIPRGLVIGKVTEVKRENNEIWQSATVEPLINIGRLTIVAVLLPDGQRL